MRGERIVYSDEEMRWLEANRMMVISDYHAAFVAAFPHHPATAANLHGLRKRLGWKVGRPPGRFVGRHLLYSKEEIAWLEENRTMETSACHAAFVERFGRTDVTVSALIGLRKRTGIKTGRTGRFEKGSVPWSKGRTMPEGKGGRHPNARKTQFKKGQRPHTWRGAGHEAVDEHGYVWIIVDQTNPYTGAATRRVQKHRWLWEQENGPVPDGHVLKCLDGDRQNCSPSNWEAIPTGLIPRLNGKSGRNYDHAPADLKPTIMAIAKLEHRARGAQKRTTPANDGNNGDRK